MHAPAPPASPAWQYVPAQQVSLPVEHATFEARHATHLRLSQIPPAQQSLSRSHATLAGAQQLLPSPQISPPLQQLLPHTIP